MIQISATIKSHCIVVLCFLLLVNCTEKVEKRDKRTIFRFNVDQGITSLDPAFSRNQANIWATNQLFNGLTQLGDSLQILPSIAKNWIVSNDGLEYTFTIRNDVYFHDHSLFKNGKGRKVLASDFVFSFNRIIDPKTASSGAWIFNDKVNPKTAFSATNDTTFLIRLVKPFPPLTGLLTAQYASVVPFEVVNYYGKDFRNNPVGTGPFFFKYWKEGETMVFLKNQNYFEQVDGIKLPFLDAVQISFISDKQTAFLQFLKKEIDFFSGIDGSYRNDILTKTGKLQEKYKGHFKLETGPYLNTEYLGILVDSNLAIVKNSPLKMKKVRQAINYAIDRKKMIKYLQNNIGTVGNAGFIPLGMPGFDSTKTKGYTYNQEKAKQLLAEAGFPNGKGMPTITLNTTTTYRDLIEFVQSELVAIGIPTKVELNQGSSLRELIAKNNVNFFRGSWIADFPDAENYLSVFYTKNFVPAGPNYTHFSNQEFDKMFEKTYFEANDSARFSLYQKMDQLVMDEAPVVILYYDKSVKLYQNTISGLGNNPLNLLNLKKVRKSLNHKDSKYTKFHKEK